jgi:hypothetical protein
MIKELEIAAGLKNIVSRKNYIMCLLTRELNSPQKSPVIVGGTAVDFYTRGLFPSRDIDIIGDRKAIGEILEKKFGFYRMGRHWGSEKLGIYIEVPNDRLSGDDPNRIATVTTCGMKMYVIGIEDLIIDRLNACVHWKSNTDCKQAEYMIRYYSSKLDVEYLKTRAKKEVLSLKTFSTILG